MCFLQRWRVVSNSQYHLLLRIENILLSKYPLMIFPNNSISIFTAVWDKFQFQYLQQFDTSLVEIRLLGTLNTIQQEISQLYTVKSRIK